MFRTINETVTFSQEIQEENSVATTTIAIKSYTNAIDDITKAYVGFLRALDFMDCQIIEELEDRLEDLKERRTFELSQVQEDTTTEEEVPLVCGMNKEFTFGNGSEDFTFGNNNTGFMFGGASYPSASKDAIVFS
tara:strand:+ start:904 stop:1308 length:405 start_codon:yes stop_codon:yes gene_type:complete